MRNMRLNALMVVLCAGWLLAGCATPDPGQDPVVIRAEQTTRISFEVFDSFLRWEEGTPLVLADEIEAFAELLREDGPAWLEDARALTRAYKSHHTEQGKADLMRALAILETALGRAQAYVAKYAGGLK